MKEFSVLGKISFDVNFDIEAETEEEAMKKAKEYLKDMYHLDTIGAYHDPKDVEIDIDCIEYEEEIDSIDDEDEDEE